MKDVPLSRHDNRTLSLTGVWTVGYALLLGLYCFIGLLLLPIAIQLVSDASLDITAIYIDSVMLIIVILTASLCGIAIGIATIYRFRWSYWGMLIYHLLNVGIIVTQKLIPLLGDIRHLSAWTLSPLSLFALWMISCSVSVFILLYFMFGNAWYSFDL